MTKPGELKAYWSKRERDLMFDWEAPATKSDGRILAELMTRVLAVLAERGYDPTTARFSIQMKGGGRG